MKTRTGFVSNSSSSSFIISFNSDPSIRENLANELGECTISETSDRDEVSSEEVVDTIHQHIMSKIPATIDELIDELSGELFWDIYTRHNRLKADGRYNGPDGRLDYDKQRAAMDKDQDDAIAPMIEKFKRENKGKFVYILEFEDCGSEYPYHEGEPFNNLTYKRVSHH